MEDRKQTLHIYIRVSTQEQVDKELSLPSQERIGIENAEKLGMEWKVYEEKGVSASEEGFMNRPKLIEILDGVKEGNIKHLFVFDQTRLSRNSTTKAIIRSNLQKHKVQLYTHSKTFDFKNLEDILTFEILEAIESYESALRKARFALGTYSANKKGRFLKGIPPYGYDKDGQGMLIINEEERKVILEIVDLYITKGYGTNLIAEYLNSNNIPTKTSKILKKGYTLHANKHNRKTTIHKVRNEWNPGTINSMLKNEAYIGRRKFKVQDGKYEEVAVDPILTEEVFNYIQQVRKNNLVTKKSHSKYFYLLKDLCQCGNCGSPMHGRTKPNRGEFTYKCNSKREKNSKCNSRGINITNLENVVWNAYLHSYNYHNIVLMTMKENFQSSALLDESLKDAYVELKKMDSLEKEIKEKRKKVLTLITDSRFQEYPTDELIAEIDKQAADLQHNRSRCLSKIEILRRSIKDASSQQDEIVSIKNNYDNAKAKHSLLQPPFSTEQTKAQARDAIKSAVKNITVTYDSGEQQYRILIEFHPTINNLATIQKGIVQTNQEPPTMVILESSQKFIPDTLPEWNQEKLSPFIDTAKSETV